PYFPSQPPTLNYPALRPEDFSPPRRGRWAFTPLIQLQQRKPRLPLHPARRHAPAATRSAARTAQFQPAARARRFFCFFLKAARLRAVFLRFFSRMAILLSAGRVGAVLGDVRRS